jgi:hypothetical protein
VTSEVVQQAKEGVEHAVESAREMVPGGGNEGGNKQEN